MVVISHGRDLWLVDLFGVVLGGFGEFLSAIVVWTFEGEKSYRLVIGVPRSAFYS